FSSQNRVILKFLNSFMEKSAVSEALEMHVNGKLASMSYETCTVLNTLVRDGNESIFEYIFDRISSKRVGELIRRRDKESNVLHCAVVGCSVGLVNKVMSQLSEEGRREVIREKGRWEFTAVHVAAYF